MKTFIRIDGRPLAINTDDWDFEFHWFFFIIFLCGEIKNPRATLVTA